MEFVALSDTVLRALALDDPQIRRVFHGVYPADQLPRSPPMSVRAAYIVNTDPAKPERKDRPISNFWAVGVATI